MKKKLLAFALAASAAVTGAFGLAACSGGGNGGTSSKWGDEYSFTAAYAQAQELGYAGSLDEFIAMISGKDGNDGTNGKDGEDGTNGKDGLGIKGISVNSDNEIVVTYTDDNSVNLGKIPPCKHEFGEWETAIEGGCDSLSVKYRVCDDCKYKDYEFTTSEHEWNDNVCTVCRYDAGGSKGLGWQLNDDDTYTLKSYFNETTGTHFTGNELVVPSTYNGLPVKSVGAEAFYRVSLSKVIINKGVTAIEDSAFYYCQALESVELPESLTDVGASAFRNCGLTEVTLPKSLEHIGVWAFRDCEKLPEISIPDGVTVIGGGAFSSNAKLTKITVDKNNAYYYVDGLRLIEKQSKTLHSVFNYAEVKSDVIPTDGSVTAIGEGVFRQFTLTEITIPETIAVIGDYAFSGSKLTAITLPESVTSIGYGAFFSCQFLAEVNIPDGVTHIGEHVFATCPALKTIAVKNNPDYYVTDNCLISKQTKTLLAVYDVANIKPDVIPADGSVTAIGEGVFYRVDYNGSWQFTEIIIPDSVTRIGKNAFYYCQRLTDVKLPKNLKEIGSSAFYYCNSLTSIVIPDGVTSIGVMVFNRCDNLTSIKYNGAVAQFQALMAKNGYTNYSYCLGGCPASSITCTDGEVDIL